MVLLVDSTVVLAARDNLLVVILGSFKRVVMMCAISRWNQNRRQRHMRMCGASCREMAHFENWSEMQPGEKPRNEGTKGTRVGSEQNVQTLFTKV
jgi:hypothetical protein